MEGVPTRLFVHQDAGGVLPAEIETVAVAAHRIVECVVGDHAVGGAIHAKTHRREKRKRVVPDLQASRPRDHQAVLSLNRAVVINLGVVTLRQINSCAKLQPFVLLVVVVRHPVDETLFLDARPQALFPVVAQVVAGEMEKR